MKKLSQKKIAELINDCFFPGPAKTAAVVLYANGVRSKDLTVSAMGKQCSVQDKDNILCAVMNAVRDLEIKDGE